MGARTAAPPPRIAAAPPTALRSDRGDPRRHARWIAEAMTPTDLSPLRPADVAALERVAHVREVAAGTVLARAGDEVHTVSVVRRGRVRLATRGRGGARRTVALVEAGGVVADVALLCEQPMPFDAVVETDATLVDLDSDDLLALLRGSPTLALRWTTSVAARLEHSQRRLATLLTKDLDAQVASLLLDARERADDGGWQTPLSHDMLAELLGVRRQSVSRVMARLRQRGVVANAYRRITLLDLDGLAELAGERLP